MCYNKSNKITWRNNNNGKASNTRYYSFFLQKVVVNPSTQCWEWTAACFSDGYGIFRSSQTQTVRAHRWSYEHYKEEITDPTLYVCHTCDNPKCVNPDHLWLGTHQQNEDDKDAKGRRRDAHLGEDNHRAVLTATNVVDIKHRLLKNETKASISRLYGISESTVRKIAQNKIWKDIPNE